MDRHQRADLHFHRLPFSYLHGLRNPGDRNHGQSPHKYGKWVDIIPATCSSKGSHTRVCDICGYQQTLDSDPLPHTWSEWVVTKNANCTERGEEERTCQVCGTTEKRTTKVNGTIHEWGEWVRRLPWATNGANGSF